MSADDAIEARLDLFDERLDHYSERLEALETAKDEHAEATESKHARVVNWAMLALFVAEIMIGIAQLVWVSHHA